MVRNVTPFLRCGHLHKCIIKLSVRSVKLVQAVPIQLQVACVMTRLCTWSGVAEKAGMGASGMDSRCGAMALRMMLRRMPAASS